MALQSPQGWIKARTQSWQNRRLPPIQQIRLTQRQVFIFFSRDGSFFVLMMIAIFVAGVNYANNLILGLCFFLGSVVIVTVYHTFNNLSGLLLETVDASDSEAGGYTTYRIRLTPNGRRVPYYLKLEWHGQAQIVERLDRATFVTFELPTPTRGRFLPARLSISTVYPLGIMRAWTDVRFNQPAWVSPKPLEGVLHGQRAATDVEDEAAIRVAGHEEFEDLRAFIQGESLSRVSWSHLARGQGLLTKQFSDTRGREQLLDYDMMSGDHERRLSQLAYWVKRLTSEQVAFALKVRDLSLEVGSGLNQQTLALRLLAEVP